MFLLLTNNTHSTTETNCTRRLVLLFVATGCRIQPIDTIIPSNLRYTQEHEWIRVEGDVAYVGITDYAQSELGEIVFVDINTEGETVAQGDVFGSVEAVKTVSDLNMPVEGEVLEVNEVINDQPELVNNDPYGEGWMIKISVADPAQLETLLDAEAYQALIG